MSHINHLLESKPLCIPKPPYSEKLLSDQCNIYHDATKKLNPHSPTITYIYRVKLARLLFTNVTVTWHKSLASHTVTVALEQKPSKEIMNQQSCKVDLKNAQSWGKKGLKSFEIHDTRVDVFWDFRGAIFFAAPEASSGFYIAIARGEETVLLLGDLKEEAYKRTKSKPSSENPTLLRKKESLCGKKLFCTRTMLITNGRQKEHDIVIETSLSGPSDPEMWISVEGTVVIRIMNLNWRFRGNETAVVNNSPIQIFWDVHDWLFSNSPSSGNGFFIFKLGAIDSSSIDNHNYDFFYSTNCDELCPNGNEEDVFCHLLYACKID